MIRLPKLLFERDWYFICLAIGLVDLLGPQNVHLSIYENDADPVTRQSLKKLEEKVDCEQNHSD